MGYRLNRLNEPVFMAVQKPLLTEFGIHYRLDSCVTLITCSSLTFCLVRMVWMMVHPLLVLDRREPAFLRMLGHRSCQAQPRAGGW